MNQGTWIDLAGIELDDIEVLSQEGGRGIPEFAASTASCGTCSGAGACSCCSEEGPGTTA